MESYRTCPFVPGSFHSARLQGSYVCCGMCQNSLPFENWIIVHCAYRPHFVYPFICQRTLGLLPPVGCWERCYKHGCTDICPGPCLSSFEYIPGSGLAGSYGYSVIIWATPSCFPWQLYHFSFPPAVHNGSNSSTLSPKIVFFSHIIFYKPF